MGTSFPHTLLRASSWGAGGSGTVREGLRVKGLQKGGLV